MNNATIGNDYWFQIILDNQDLNVDWNVLSSNINVQKDKEDKDKEDKELFELRIKFQQFVQDYLFEEFVKIAFHPDKINKYLDMGYTIDELDSIM